MRQDSPAEIERQLHADRAAIDQTIDAIQHRLSPGQLLDQALGYARANGGEAVSSVTRSAKENPWPLVMTAVSLAWLMRSTTSSGNGYAAAHDYDYTVGGTEPTSHDDTVARSRAAGESVLRQAGETEAAFEARVTEAKAGALSLKRDAEETAEAFKERVEAQIARLESAAAHRRRQASAAVSRGSHALGDGARHVRAQADATQARARELYTHEPLIVGAVGVMAGALIGALLPSTRTEDRAFGEAGAQVREKASGVAADVAERSKAAAAEGIEAAAPAAEAAARGDVAAAPDKGDGAKQPAERTRAGSGAGLP